MMNASRSMTIAMEALAAAHPVVLAVIVAGIAVLITTAFVIDGRAERSRP